MEMTVDHFVQILDWIRDVGELYLASHTTVGSSVEDTQALLQEFTEFKSASKVDTVSFRAPIIAKWADRFLPC